MIVILQYYIFPVFLAFLLSFLDYYLDCSKKSPNRNHLSKASPWIWSMSIFLLIFFHIFIVWMHIGKESASGFIASIFILIFTAAFIKIFLQRK